MDELQAPETKDLRVKDAGNIITAYLGHAAQPPLSPLGWCLMSRLVLASILTMLASPTLRNL